MTAPPRLRVGVMTRGTMLARWQRSVLEHLIVGADATLVVLVVEDSRIPPARPRLFDRRLLWRLYNNFWVRRRAASVARVDCSDVLAALPAFGGDAGPRRALHPTPSARGDRGAARLRPRRLLRFAFGILGGEVLDVARHGIWSFHHDDEP